MNLGRVDRKVLRDFYSEPERPAVVEPRTRHDLDSEVEQVAGVWERDLNRQREFELGHVFLEADLRGCELAMHGEAPCAVLLFLFLELADLELGLVEVGEWRGTLFILRCEGRHVSRTYHWERKISFVWRIGRPVDCSGGTAVIGHGQDAECGAVRQKWGTCSKRGTVISSCTSGRERAGVFPGTSCF